MMSQSDTFARAILGAVFSGVLASAALALVVVAVARSLRPSATTRHVLWWIVFSTAALLPVATVAISFQRIEHRPATTAHRNRDDARDVAYGTRSRTSLSPPDPLSMTMPASSGEKSPVDRIAESTSALGTIASAPVLPSALVAIAFAVAALRLGLLVPALLWLLGAKRAALPLDEDIVRRLRRYRHGMRVGRAATILLSADVDVPIAVGFGNPAILLPIRVAETESIADLDHIVMHEHAHLNRYDDVTNLLQCLVERLFWFNPVIAFAGRRISLEREIACDDSVVAQTGRAHRYATCLWKLVESARLPARPVVAPGALLTPNQITRRIEQLLDSKRNAIPRLSPTSAIVLGTLAAALIFFQAGRAPVIAIEDAVAAPAVSADILAAPVPAALPTPAPRRLATRANDRAPDFRIQGDATPEAMANAVIAATLAQSKKTLGDAASRRVPDVAVLGASMGLDVAKTISEKLAPASQWPQIARSIERAKNDVRHEIASTAGGDTAMIPEGTHRALQPFHRISIEGSVDVIIRHGPNTYVDFQGDTYVSSHTTTRVEKGSLIVDQINGSYDDHHKSILVYTPDLDAVTIDGSADATVEHVDAAKFAIKIYGSGNVTARGAVTSVSISIEGSGDADLLGLYASSATISNSGSGNVKIAAPKTLAIHIDGSGDISIRGTVKTLSTDINGSGSVHYI